jgi:hypothetical protein
MTIRKVRGGRAAGRGRARRSRALARHEDKVDNCCKHRLDAEKRTGSHPQGKPLKPCPDCGCIKREKRKYFRGSWGWTPFCTDCWLKRGKPRVDEAIKIAEGLEQEAREAAEAEHKRALDAGEIPW